MPMGIVSDEDFLREIKDSSVPVTPLDTDDTPVVIDGVVEEMERPGRKEGDLNVPDSLRKLIGEASQIDGRQDALQFAEKFGISPSSVSAYANGSKSTASMDKQPNLPHINNAKQRISKKAQRKLFKALNNLTDEKLENTKAVELAQIARSMSAVVREMEPETEVDKKDKPQFIVYSPQIRDERHYEVKVVRD